MKTTINHDTRDFFELGTSIPAFFLLLLVFQLFFMPGLLHHSGHLYVPFKKIIVGGSPNNPPYEYLDENNEPAGYNVDLTRAVAAEMKIEVEIHLAEKRIIEKLFAEGKIDLLQGITHNTETLKHHAFSSHSTYSQKVFSNSDYPEYVTSLKQLKDGKLFLSKNTPFLTKLIASHPEIEFYPVISQAEALRQLDEGQADYVLTTNLPGQYLTRELDFLRQRRPESTITQIGELQSVLGYGYLARNDNTDILKHVNESLVNLKLSGRQKEIQEQWLGKIDNSEISKREKSVQLGGRIFSPLLLVVCAVFFWNHSLKREVNRRSKEIAVQHHQLIQADKMTSLGILVAGVAHEINNPTALILHNLSTLKRISDTSNSILEDRYREEGDFLIGGLPYSILREESPQLFAEMKDSANRITQIVNDLKDFARKDSMVLTELTSLNDVVTSSLRLLESSIPKQITGVQLLLNDTLPPFLGNSSRIQQVAINLVMNACQAGNSPDLRINISTFFKERTGEVVLQIRDNGSGIEPEKLVYLCDPFYTTKRDMGGTGLGLFISERIVKEHKGRLTFDSKLGVGTTVSMYLPAKLV